MTTDGNTDLYNEIRKAENGNYMAKYMNFLFII